MYFFGNSLRTALAVLTLIAAGIGPEAVSQFRGGVASAQTSSQSLSPQAAAIAKELARGGKKLAELREYYAKNGYRPIWLKNRNKVLFRRRCRFLGCGKKTFQP